MRAYHEERALAMVLPRGRQQHRAEGAFREYCDKQSALDAIQGSDAVSAVRDRVTGNFHIAVRGGLGVEVSPHSPAVPSREGRCDFVFWHACNPEADPSPLHGDLQPWLLLPWCRSAPLGARERTAGAFWATNDSWEEMTLSGDVRVMELFNEQG